MPQDSGVISAPPWSQAPHRNDKVGLEALRSPFASDHCDDLVDAPIFLEAETWEGKGAAPIPALQGRFQTNRRIPFLASPYSGGLSACEMTGLLSWEPWLLREGSLWVLS